jgi:hypothetical protein
MFKKKRSLSTKAQAKPYVLIIGVILAVALGILLIIWIMKNLVIPNAG